MIGNALSGQLARAHYLNQSLDARKKSFRLSFGTVTVIEDPVTINLSHYNGDSCRT